MEVFLHPLISVAEEARFITPHLLQTKKKQRHHHHSTVLIAKQVIIFKQLENKSYLQKMKSDLGFVLHFLRCSCFIEIGISRFILEVDNPPLSRGA